MSEDPFAFFMCGGRDAPRLCKRALLSMAICAVLSAVILVPFFSGNFPPLISSLALTFLGFFLFGAAIGVPFRRPFLLGLAGMVLTPLVLGMVDGLGLWRGYTEPPKQDAGHDRVEETIP